MNSNNNGFLVLNFALSGEFNCIVTGQTIADNMQKLYLIFDKIYMYIGLKWT